MSNGMEKLDLKPPTIDAICLVGTKLKEISPNARLTCPPIDCDVTDTLKIINPTIYGYQIRIHNSCICNEQQSLHNRHLIDRTYIRFDSVYFNKNFKSTAKLWHKLEVAKCTYWDVAMSYTGRKRRVYMQARLDLLDDNGSPSDSNIKMFVKPDKIPLADVFSKAPRAIQYRHPRFNLQLATYLRPFEHEFYSLPGKGPSASRVITKGLNPQQIAALFLLKVEEFVDPVFIGADHAKFDSTVNEQHLRAEHSVYIKCFRSKTLRDLLRKQINNRGYSRRGIKYSVKGTRMSGDYNTGLGNSLLSRAVLESWLVGFKHEIMLDGDDSVIIIEREDLHYLDYTHFERMGFETKFEFTDNIQRVTYCQKRLVFGTIPSMVRNPIRAMSNMVCCIKNYTGTGYNRWLAGVFECESMANLGSPVLGHFPKTHTRVLRDEEYNRKMASLEGMEATVLDRCSYQMAWGLDLKTQVDIEQYISTYLGYNSTGIIGFLIRVLKSRLFNSELVKHLQYGYGSFAKHQTTVGERFHAMDTCIGECWHTATASDVGHEGYELSFTPDTAYIEPEPPP